MTTRRGRTGPEFKSINECALRHLPHLLRLWLPDGYVCGQEFIALNPTRADRRHGSFKINLITGRWADFATGDKGGDVISLAAYLTGLSQTGAAHRLAQMIGFPL